MANQAKRQVVIIDDDPAVCDSFDFWLKTVGFTVATYPSAVAFLANPPVAPRCLLVDQNMPQMTGTELAATLRERGNAVPILLISTSISPALAARAAAVGIQRVLEKPAEEHDLLGFIAESF